MGASFHLICSGCGKRKGASPIRFEKWQVRLKDPSKRYLCKDCRKKYPKQMNVTIPDETLPMAKGEGMTGLIRQVYGFQTLKIKKR